MIGKRSELAPPGECIREMELNELDMVGGGRIVDISVETGFLWAGIAVALSGSPLLGFGMAYASWNAADQKMTAAGVPN